MSKFLLFFVAYLLELIDDSNEKIDTTNVFLVLFFYQDSKRTNNVDIPKKILNVGECRQGWIFSSIEKQLSAQTLLTNTLRNEHCSE